jgi:hypothetical protein
MADKEIRIKHEDIQDPSTITRVNAEAFKKAGLDIHVNGVESLDDDHKRGERILRVHKTTKYFFQKG